LVSGGSSNGGLLKWIPNSNGLWSWSPLFHIISWSFKGF
jgi:hypothetical protein